MIELVTGYTGTAHVSAEDDGELYAGIFGTDNCVLNVRNKMSASVDTSNGFNVVIGTGSAIVGGRHVRIASPETLQFSGGSQGTFRRDAICIKYAKAQDGTESAEVVLIEGTPSDNGYIDPEIPAGTVYGGANPAYMLLYHLDVNGTNYSIVKKFKTYRPDGGDDSEDSKNVIAFGKSGNWEWTAWSNGELEMRGTWTGTANCNKSWGGGYWGDVNLAKTYPTDIGYRFISKPKVFPNLRADGGYYWALCWNDDTTAKTCRISPAGFGYSTGKAYVLDIEAKGWWK